MRVTSAKPQDLLSTYSIWCTVTLRLNWSSLSRISFTLISMRDCSRPEHKEEQSRAHAHTHTHTHTHTVAEETKSSRMKLCYVLKNFKNLPITRDYGRGKSLHT